MSRRGLEGLALALVCLVVSGCAIMPGHKPPQAPTSPEPVAAAQPPPAPPADTPAADAPDDAVGEPAGEGKREPPSRPKPATSLPDTAGAETHELPTIERAMTDEERKLTLQRVIVDTAAAGAAIRRCTGRVLLPDQESVFETANSLLAQTAAALKRDELWRAESLARKARQLASSLSCP